MPGWKVRDHGLVLRSGFRVSKKKMFFARLLTSEDPILWGASVTSSDRHGSNFEYCVRMYHSSHHPQEVLLAQFNLYEHTGGLNPHSYIPSCEK